jgi:RNase P subunit RPR2
VNEDTMPSTAKQLEHCHKCYRLIHPGETCHQTAKDTVLCKQCTAGEPLDTIQVSDGVMVNVHEGQLTIRGEARRA